MTPRPKPHLLASLSHAIRGWEHAAGHERNLRIHLGAALAVLGFCVIIPLDRASLLWVLGVTSLVLITELLNCAVEATVDLVTAEPHPLARIAKDTAAGAVLGAVLLSLATAWWILRPALVETLGRLPGPPWTRIGEAPWAAAGLAASSLALALLSLRALRPPPAPSACHQLAAHAALGFGLAACLAASSRQLTSTLGALPLWALLGRPQARDRATGWPASLGAAGAGVGLCAALHLCSRALIP